MPNGRPYDPNLLASRTARHTRGGTPAGPQPVPPTVIHEAGFEHYPSRWERFQGAIANLGQIIVGEGREDRRAETAERLERRIRVARYVGDRIMNPRTNPSSLTEKIGWVGYDKRQSSPNVRPEQHANLGKQLMDYKNVSRTPPARNELRPTTNSEQRVGRQIDNLIRGRRGARKLRREARWLSQSYGRSLSRGHHELSKAERKEMARTGRRIEKLETKASRKEAKAEAIANSQNWRGRFVRWRLERARD